SKIACILRSQKLLNYQITQLPNYSITKLLNYQITQLPNYSITKLLNYQISSSSVFFQELLRFHGRGAARTGCGDRLAIAAVLHVSPGKDARHARHDEVVGVKGAVIVPIELAP